MPRILAPVLLSLALAMTPMTAQGHEGHMHAMHDVAAENAPRITEFRVEADAGGGWNVTLTVENFTFVEDGATDLPEGHAGHVHLSINGTEFGMYFARTFHIDELPKGPHELKVVLSSLEHADYAVNGRPIEASTSITVE
jgi:hypothetical protein